MMNTIYTIPKLCKAKGGWYIHLRYNGIQKRYKFKLNYIQNLEVREREFKMLRNALHKKLKEGWNPLVPDLEIEQNDILLIDALEFALEKKKSNISPKSYSGYKGTVKFIKESIVKLHMEYLTIDETKRIHIKRIAEKAKQLNKWSNKSYNKNLNYLSAVIDELLEWDILEYNFVHKIKRLPVEESTANRAPELLEHQMIKKELMVNHPYFYNFLETEYHTGIRPKEILSIQLNMIHLDVREIRLPPKITKSGIKKRNVIINNHLHKMLSEMDLSMYPEDFYLFGSYRENGRGNVGKHLDFVPGPTPIKRDTATNRWKRIIKDGLGIDINMYAYKHKGGDDKLIAGIDLDSIRNQYGHSEKKMTERYVKQIKGVYKKDIIDNSPEF